MLKTSRGGIQLKKQRFTICTRTIRPTSGLPYPHRRRHAHPVPHERRRLGFDVQRVPAVVVEEDAADVVDVITGPDRRVIENKHSTDIGAWLTIRVKPRTDVRMRRRRRRYNVGHVLVPNAPHAR